MLIAQHAVADALIRHRAQLLLDRLDCGARSAATGERVVEIDAGHIDGHGVDAGEPANRAGDIAAGQECFGAAVTFQGE